MSPRDRKSKGEGVDLVTKSSMDRRYKPSIFSRLFSRLLEVFKNIWKS